MSFWLLKEVFHRNLNEYLNRKVFGLEEFLQRLFFGLFSF